MKPNYTVETSGGAGRSMIVSNYPCTNLVFNFKYNIDYKPFIDSYAIGVWKVKK